MYSIMVVSGKISDVSDDFGWIKFYSEFANNLLTHKDNRKPLVDNVHKSTEKVGNNIPSDKFSDGTEGPIKDICPFTTMGLFNKGIKDDTRTKTAGELAKFLKVKTLPPNSFEGLPRLSNLKAWFFRFANKRDKDDINTLWSVFASALEYADSDNESNRERFARLFNETIKIKGVNYNLTMGLFWIRPYFYLPLDEKTRVYLEECLKVEIPKNLNAETYLELINKVKQYLKKDSSLQSIPMLSLMAYNYTKNSQNNTEYTTKNIVEDGCFLEESKLLEILSRLESRKNLILQGPPGTGKTYLAKRLAYALIGHKPNPCDANNPKIRSFQFHPNISYEDFVQGWRPVSGGKLELSDGPFLNAVKDAKKEPSSNFVMVIEEINRGNPANIFGEMLTLLEVSKRNESAALRLTYSQGNHKPVYVPPNLHIIGTMNVADRSLAFMDFALRRRFSFIDLEPIFGGTWKKYVNTQTGIDIEFLNKVANRLESLNEEISKDPSLGPNFRIGHSYVTPHIKKEIDSTERWFSQIVDTEICPLLDEYWFEDPNKAEAQKRKLREKFAD